MLWDTGDMKKLRPKEVVRVSYLNTGLSKE